MKLAISPAAARAAALVAIAGSTFLNNAIDAPTTHNGAWMCPLIAALIALPWILCIDGMRKQTGRARAAYRPLCALLAAIALWDAADVLSAIVRSAGYLALDCLPKRLLTLPVFLAALWCLFKNGDAIGYAAMLFARLAVTLLAVVVILQLRHYRPAWLSPLLGSGWSAIAGGSVRTAGRIAACSSILLCADDAPREERSQGKAAATVLAASGLGALLVALYLMMTPTAHIPTGWINRLDSLLTNGRGPLYMQLPLIVFWYAGLMHLMICECFGGACLFQRAFPRLDGRACALIAAGGVAALSGLGGLSALYVDIMPWSFALVMPLTALTVFASLRREARRHCA